MHKLDARTRLIVGVELRLRVPVLYYNAMVYTNSTHELGLGNVDEGVSPERLFAWFGGSDLGFRIWGLENRVWGLGLGFLGFGSWGLRFRAWGLEFTVRFGV
jgi:hypothetical protein